MKFIDYVEIDVRSGSGGNGSASFRREKHIAKGGPDGGDGGRGGDIMLRADSNLTTLLDFRYRNKYKAGNGEMGHGALKKGKSGETVIIEVPIGTIVKDMESEQIIFDLNHEGQEETVARGGRGGRGNNHFKSPTNQTPRTAEEGRTGVQMKLSLELKLLADVGLVGLPNAGKSTMLSRLSAARPKIADYPFTTLKPNLGIVRLRKFKSFVMADIPGIIEGASDGKGLGLQFLKHIQRTRLILYLIDINTDEIDNTLDLLKNELNDFDPELVKRPFLVVLNKIDIIEKNRLKVISKTTKSDYILFSAVSGQGEKELLKQIENVLDKNA